VYLAVPWSYAEYVTAYRYEDLESVSRACKVAPANLRVCIRKAMLEQSSGRFKASLQTLKTILVQEPHFFPAIGSLHQMHWRRVKSSWLAARCAVTNAIFPRWGLLILPGVSFAKRFAVNSHFRNKWCPDWGIGQPTPHIMSAY
jgi:hypothetical protein